MTDRVTMREMTNKPVLHNVRILDFTWVLAGPYASRLLADFGAEVIKVQPLVSTEDDDAFSRGYYNTWNRNKLGITLNLNMPEGIALVKKLVSISDAVMENFTPHVMSNWGLDYPELKKIRPDIIMVSMSVMGRQSYYNGYGPTVHALSGMTGLMSLNGRPVGPGFSYADLVAGLYASLSLLEALEHRRRRGRGRHIDLSEVDIMKEVLKEKEPPLAVNSVYRCKDEDRWCAITVDTEGAWRGLKRAMGNPAWAEDSEFATPDERISHKEELDRLMGAWAGERTTEELLSLLRQNGVAAGIIQDAADLACDPQLKERGFYASSGGTPFTDASPVRMGDIEMEYREAPFPGRDNAYVYGELLGLSKKEIEDLKTKGVI